MTGYLPPRVVALCEVIGEAGCSWCGTRETDVERAPGLGFTVIIRHWASCPVIQCLPGASPKFDLEVYALRLARRGFVPASYSAWDLAEIGLMPGALAELDAL